MSLSEELLIDIVKEELGLPNAQVWIRNQNREIPADGKLYVVIGMVQSRIVSAKTSMIEEAGLQYEINSVTTFENIQIDFFSSSDEASLRRFEFVAALSGFYAQQVQEKNFFKIYKIPSQFLNTSAAEGGSQLNRYTITVAVGNSFNKKREMLTGVPNGKRSWFDTFPVRVDDEKTIGEDTPLFEFELPIDTQRGFLLTEAGGRILTEAGDFIVTEN